ncbi:MAG: NAD-binding protein, partial [Gammaproteobacteria bacterium]|nr:NAD-binding protein [Gammaproteobacteria bacterium]NIW43869.1 NAD-binding protein [Gammaproteobacteria bacterium]NIW99189.1 NAD-binding protein [Phycisphaerae bacterium]
EKDEITAIAYETIETDDGELPILTTSSEVAGRMAPIIAGELLGSFRGGRGILLSGVAGTPPAAVVILGAGVLGMNAARAFHNMGAQVTVLDHDLRKLQHVDTIFEWKVASMFANSHNIAKAVAFADVLIGAASIPGGKAPILVSREMLKMMRKRAVILDMSINSGGCVETSRPTTLADPSYIVDDIIHYCVPNVPARVSRSASHSLSNSILPYLLEMGRLGIPEALDQLSDLRRGVNMMNGKLVHPEVAAALGKTMEERT